MDYRIEEIKAFSVIGQEVVLTNYQRQNIEISKSFWKQFNLNLKKLYLSQFGNWTKFAFMERKDGKLIYYCAIPERLSLPEGFIHKVIEEQRYLVFEHLGSMDNIYNTYGKIYKEMLPHSEYTLNQKSFLHFEKYDYRFQWNRDNSVIEIWIPIKGDKNVNYNMQSG